MKLNYDCIRDVLLEIEKSQMVSTSADGDVQMEALWIEKIYSALPKYSKEDIFYSLFNLEQAGYVDLSIQWMSGCVRNCAINHMTFMGHEFLNSIRDSKRWKAIKSGLSVIKDYSLSAIGEIAHGATSALINTFLENTQL